MVKFSLRDHNQVLQEAFRYVVDDPEKALDLLDQGLFRSEAARDSYAAASLAKHAGVVAMRNGFYTRAEGYFERLVAHDPEGPSGYLALGECCEKLGKGEAALRLYSKSLEIAVEGLSEPDAEMARKAIHRFESK